MPLTRFVVFAIIGLAGPSNATEFDTGGVDVFSCNSVKVCTAIDTCRFQSKRGHLVVGYTTALHLGEITELTEHSRPENVATYVGFVSASLANSTWRGDFWNGNMLESSFVEDRQNALSLSDVWEKTSEFPTVYGTNKEGRFLIVEGEIRETKKVTHVNCKVLN